MVCKCVMLLKTLIVLNTWTFGFGSLIEINGKMVVGSTFAGDRQLDQETSQGPWPQLYALDDWSQCQRPGDVYCTVDAELVSDGSEGSALLELLYNYSEQTLKHYNRTLIHRGVCVSRCGVNESIPETWQSAAQDCLNKSVTQYGVQARVVSVDLCSAVDTPPEIGSPRALAVPCIIIVMLAFLATSLHVLGERCGKNECNKYLLAFSIKRNWAILTYDRSKPRTDERMKDIACMEGIRFLGIQGVIFSHVIFIYLYSYIDNPQFIENMYDQVVWQYILNSPLWLQAFFSLSGFLSAYTVLIVTESGQYNWLKCILAIVNRWIRLTPLAGFALWFTMVWFPLLGSGPQWGWLVRREAIDCSGRWWYHLLYVHNHLPLGKLCMGHTWYLAVDMQLHVLGMLLLLLMVRYRRTVIPILSTLLVATSLAAGVVVYVQQLTPIITAQSPEALRTMFASSKILPQLYLPVWMNLSGYVCGIGSAFLFYHCQTNGIKLNTNKVFNIVFHLAMPVGTCVVLSGIVFLSDSPPPLWAAAVYSALDRTLVAVCFNVFMLGCFFKCKSAIREAIEWRGFHTLGRLSYSAYLVHFIVLRLTLASSTQLGHASILSMVSLLITSSVYTYIVSVPLCLMVELPMVQLWKAVVEPDRVSDRPATPAPAHPPTSAAKTFDLVAQLARRHQSLA